MAWLPPPRKPWIVPLFGTRKLERLDKNLGALSATLAVEDPDEIERVAPALRLDLAARSIDPAA